MSDDNAMEMNMNCPKCDADLSDSYEPEDWSVGISAGWYCDVCNLAVGDDGYREPMEDDILIGLLPRNPDAPLGTPISELSGQPGPKDDIAHPNHTRYAEFCRIAKSWGYE